MFDLEKFLDMIARNRYTKKKLADRLGISVSSLYRRIEKGGAFSVDEVRIMIALFGKDDVLNSLF